MASVNDDPERLSEAIRRVRENDIEGLASLYMDGFDIRKHHKSLMCWASESGNEHTVVWIRAVAEKS